MEVRDKMYYTLYEIDDKNKTIYMKIEENTVSNEMLLNINNDYERIVKFANENNYTIKLYEQRDNYEDIFSFKKHL